MHGVDHFDVYDKNFNNIVCSDRARMKCPFKCLKMYIASADCPLKCQKTPTAQCVCLYMWTCKPVCVCECMYLCVCVCCLE